MSEATPEEINIFRCLDYIRDNAAAFAQAKGNLIYLEQFRKTKKALCMRDAELGGVKTLAAQERDAYANEEYVQLLHDLKAATEVYEEYRWKMVAAEAKIEVWRTIQATQRIERKVIQ